MLPGTEDGSFPFWSPDSKSIGFFARNRLLRADVAGGAPLAICETEPALGATWSSDGYIVFGRLGSGLLRVPVSGGTALPLTNLASGETSHFFPQILPNGRLLYFSSAGIYGIYATSVAKPADRVPLLTAGSPVVYAPGGDGKNYLLWLRETR